MAKDTLRLLEDGLQEHHPKTIKLCYPRRILPPQGYYNPRWYGVSLCVLMRFWQEPEYNMLPHTTGALMALMQTKMGVPTYFLKQDYAEAVAQTNPPDDFRLTEIQWPLDAFLFVLPDAFVRQYFGWYVPFLTVARCAKGIYPHDAKPLPSYDVDFTSTIANAADRLLVHYPLYLYTRPPVDYTGAYPLTSPISVIQSAPWADATYYEESLSPYGKIEWATDGHKEPTPEEEQELQRKVNSFAIKLMLALTAEPGYLERGGIARQAKVRKGVTVKDSLWHPNLLGWNYTAPRPPSDTGEHGTHASPRWHWRSGHMTYQVKGARSALVPVNDLPRKPVTDDIPPAERGKIDWDKVSPEVSAAFWASHALKWIKPVLVNATVKDRP